MLVQSTRLEVRLAAAKDLVLAGRGHRAQLRTAFVRSTRCDRDAGRGGGLAQPELRHKRIVFATQSRADSWSGSRPCGLTGDEGVTTRIGGDAVAPIIARSAEIRRIRDFVRPQCSPGRMRATNTSIPPLWLRS